MEFDVKIGSLSLIPSSILFFFFLFILYISLFFTFFLIHFSLSSFFFLFFYISLLVYFSHFFLSFFFKQAKANTFLKQGYSLVLLELVARRSVISQGLLSSVFQHQRASKFIIDAAPMSSSIVCPPLFLILT